MTSAAAGATLVDEQKRRQSCEMHRARLKATSDCRLLVHSFGSVAFVTELLVDSFGAFVFVTVELRASRASLVVKEGACLQGRLGGFSASLQRKAGPLFSSWPSRLDGFSAAGLSTTLQTIPRGVFCMLRMRSLMFFFLLFLFLFFLFLLFF